MGAEKITNEQIAEIFKELGAILELKGENPFKARAYYNAARVIEKLPVPMEEMINSGEIVRIKGIGEAVIKKSKVLIETGQLPYYEKLKSSIPPGLLEMLKIPGLGPRKVRKLWQELGITNIGELEYACDVNRLVSLEGFGLKTQQKVLEGIKFLKKYSDKHFISDGIAESELIASVLQEFPKALQMHVVGSVRRRCEIIGEIEVLVAIECELRSELLNFIKEAFSGADVKEKDENIVFRSPGGIPVVIHLVDKSSFIPALFYFTGSDSHVRMIEKLLIDKGYRFVKNAILGKTGRVNLNSEADIYALVGLPFIPPELREGRDELELAGSGEICELVKMGDIKGCFHIHSNYSDGINSVGEMVIRARELGYSFISISDHSKSAFYANGLDEARLEQQWKEIDEINEKYPDFRVFKSIESDILVDGSLDYEDRVLEKFDFVIASVHSRFALSASEQTERVLRAIRNPFVKMLAHPTGRLLLARKGYEIDLERVLREIAKLDKVVEINASPHRLDLDWRWGKLVRELNVKIAINPDAHNVDDISDVEYGVYVARKAGIPGRNILNTWSVEKLEAFFRKKE